MKITNDSKFVNHDIDIIEMIEQLQEKYRTVYWIHLDGDIYVYKPLGRKDYKEILENEELNKMDKEDEVIKKCLLYPKLLNLDEMVAGISNQLFTTIMENSFLSDMESRVQIMDYYRSEMHDLDNQIPCIINEAFPQYDIEEIENWDIERTAKYLSRAEWKLQNFRGMEFNQDIIKQQQEEMQKSSNDNNQDMEPDTKQDMKTDTSKSKEPLTPEKLRELQSKFPEIDWTADTITQEGEKGMSDSVDTVSPALRVGN